MNKIVHYIGLDVHKDSSAVSIAPQNSTDTYQADLSAAAAAKGMRKSAGHQAE